MKLCGCLDRLIEATNQYRRCHMIQHSLVAQRLTMNFQHCGEAQKPKSNCSMSLKAQRARGDAIGQGPILLRID